SVFKGYSIKGRSMPPAASTEQLSKPASPTSPHPNGPLAPWLAGDKPAAIALADGLLAGSTPALPWQRAEALLIRSFQADGRDDYDSAVAFAEEAATLAPGHMIAQVRRTSLLRRTGGWQRAVLL